MSKVRVPVEIIVISLVQILLFIIAGFKFPVLLCLLLPSVMLLIQRNYVRIFNIVLYFFALSLTFTVTAYTLAATENKLGNPVIVITCSCLAGILFIYILFSLLFRSKYKDYYNEPNLSGLGTATIPVGWICPVCKSKIHYSLKCWNCGHQKDSSGTDASQSEKTVISESAENNGNNASQDNTANRNISNNINNA